VTFAPRHSVLIATFAAALVTLAACSSVRSDYVKTPSTALPPAVATPRAKNIAAQADNHPNESGFRLLTQSENALLSRIALADHAQRSIDLQYYIFNNDATGRLVMQHLVAAADRGVRVRLLIDDINLRDEIDVLNALNAHANIKVRLFNPFKTRDPSSASKALQFVMDARRLNRRMHNKSFIVDNNVAVVGGRNIGDGYFSVSKDLHFRDLDLIAIGPVVREASDAFDA
jgi:putative cardiolipin synthase